MNQAYTTPEDRIQSIKVPLGPNHYASDSERRQQTHDASRRFHNATGSQSGTFDPRYDFASCGLTKEDLRQVTVINQVDRKFIACRTSDAPSSGLTTVILIDQHAADERIRVERFLRQLCIGFLHSGNRTNDNRKQWVRVKELAPPVPVLLTYRDASMVMQSQDGREFLRKWGIQIESPLNRLPMSDKLASESESPTHAQLLVSAVPEVVSEKVRATKHPLSFVCSLVHVTFDCQLLQGDELRDLIQGFLAQMECGELVPDSQLDFHSDTEQGELAWLKALRYCPRGLLELVNSKACRGMRHFGLFNN